jgi:hypothetical protein
MLYPSPTTPNGAMRMGPLSNGQLGGKDLSFCLWAQEDRDEEDRNTDHGGDEDGAARVI